MRPNQTFQALEKLRNSSSVTLRRKGVELSSNDSQTVLDVYQQWLALLIDLDYLHPESLERDARRLWVDLTQADVLDLNNVFAECLYLVRVQSNKGFKALCKRISPHLYAFVKGDMDMMLSGDVYAAKRLIQLFSYTTRLSLTDIDLTQQMLEDYLATEERIQPLDSKLDTIISDLNKIIKRWMASFDTDQIYPQHGPGGVAGCGRCSVEVKYKNLTTDQLLEYAFGEPTWVSEPIRASFDRISQTIFVPKSYKTFRTISMEPPTLMFFQQGVWRQIEKMVYDSSYLRDHIGFDTRGGNPKYLRNHIGFKDQERNRKLARKGSIDRDFATIDLSAASDSVSYELVKRLFKGTKLLRYLVALRSKRTLLPDGRVITMKKYAPMGSALCFPVETLVFAAICEHVTRVGGFAGKYSVFGDDIIVPTQCVDTTMRFLELLGFRVNRDKSFYQQDCWFRESCGGEYCDGFDVTPMRISRKYASVEQDVRIDKLIQLANNAYVRGYRNLRHFFLEKIRKEGYTPLFSPTSLLADNYTNYHTKRRWNRNLQRIEVKVTTFVDSPSKESLAKQDELLRYHHWFYATAGRSAIGDGFESVICRSTTKIQCTWREKPFEEPDQLFVDLNLSRG